MYTIPFDTVHCSVAIMSLCCQFASQFSTAFALAVLTEDFEDVEVIITTSGKLYNGDERSE